MASHYTIPQLYQLAVQAGWDPAVAPYVAATAWVESSGDPTAASGTGPVGLMQINRRNAQALGYRLDDRLDPLTNMKMALQLWKNQGGAGVPPEKGFRDWWPYDRNNADKEAAFQKALAEAKKSAGGGSFLDGLGAALSPVPPGSDTNPVTALGNAFSGIGKLADQFGNFAKMMAWFVNPANDIRVMLGVFGVLFLGAGVWMLGREVRRG